MFVDFCTARIAVYRGTTTYSYDYDGFDEGVQEESITLSQCLTDFPVSGKS